MRTLPAIAASAALTLALGAGLTPAQGMVSRPAASRDCASTPEGTIRTISPAGHVYMVQRDEYNSSASETACTDGAPTVSVSASSISVATDAAPGAYTSVYRGCHWGDCTTNSGFPLAVSSLDARPWRVHLTEQTTVPKAGAWDDSFDIFYTPTRGGSQRGQDLEMMIWLQHGGPVQPAGSEVARHVKISSHYYNVWWSGHTVSFVFILRHVSVSGLSLGHLSAYAVRHKYMASSWYLIDVESGFELWRGGAGARLSSLSVCTPAGC
jgi:Glycosyl hydrolase family 12